MLDILVENAVKIEQTILYKLIFNRNQKLTYNEYKQILNQSGAFLYYIPIKFRTEDLCKIAVSNLGSAIIYVPQEFRTKEICEIMIKYDETLACYIPPSLRYKFKDIIINNNYIYNTLEINNDTF